MQTANRNSVPESRTTIIIPNWNGLEHLQRLLPAIARQTRRPARVLVVDNGSQDGSVEYAQTFSDILPLRDNRGFAYAVNRGIEQAATEFVLLLNNDTDLAPDALQSLEDALSQPHQYACPLLLRMHQPDIADGAFDLLSRAGCPERAIHGMNWKVTASATMPRQVYFPPLTATLVRRSLFQAIGLLDERFESYLEDVEFGIRAARHGHHGIFVPAAVVLHHGSATLGRGSERITFLNARNQLHLVAQHYPRNLLRRWFWPLLVGHLLYCVAAARHGVGGAALRGKLAALRHWISWRRESAYGTADSLGGSVDVQQIIQRSEAELYELFDQQSPKGTFWTTYFRLCGAPGGTKAK